MGYRVEAYSLDELRRISEPGAVVPSLFWLLPVGRWHPRELDDLWQLFTNPRSGLCHNVGLVLVKDMMKDRSHPRSPLDLSSLAADLRDILPQGAEEYLPRAHRRKTPRQFLLLSGAYPQPGWGLLVDTPDEPVSRFVERLVGTTMDKLSQVVGCDDAVSSISRATESFHQLQRIKEGSPPRFDVSGTKDNLQQLRDRATNLKVLQKALDNIDLVALDAARQKICAQVPGYIKLSVCDEKVLAEFKLARHVASITEDEEKHTLISILEKVAGAEEDNRVLLAHKVRKQQFGKIAMLWAGLKETGPSPKMIISWAAECYPKLLDQFKQETHEALKETEKQIGAVIVETEQQEEVHKKKVCQYYDDAVRQANAEFRLVLQDAWTYQWNWGPRFLVSAEAVCRKDQIDCRNIAWDPARMVGWKVWTLGVSVTVEDLHVKAQSLLAGSSESGEQKWGSGLFS